jgi:hypothetical protein
MGHMFGHHPKEVRPAFHKYRVSLTCDKWALPTRNCGFYPGAHPRECTDGTAATFDQARADFDEAWRVFLSNRTEADFQEWRDQRDLGRRHQEPVEPNAALGAAISTAEMFDPDVATSGALDRAATESLTGSSRDRSETSLNPSDPRIGQNPRDAMGSLNRVERSDRNSVINRNRW